LRYGKEIGGGMYVRGGGRGRGKNRKKGKKRGGRTLPGKRILSARFHEEGGEESRPSRQVKRKRGRSEIGKKELKRWSERIGTAARKVT